jgi:hypothetical protein
VPSHVPSTQCPSCALVVYLLRVPSTQCPLCALHVPFPPCIVCPPCASSLHNDILVRVLPLVTCTMISKSMKTMGGLLITHYESQLWSRATMGGLPNMVARNNGRVQQWASSQLYSQKVCFCRNNEQCT